MISVYTEKLKWIWQTEEHNGCTSHNAVQGMLGLQGDLK